MTTRNILSGSGPSPDDPLPPDGRDGTSGAGAPAGNVSGGAGGRIRAAIDPERDLTCCRLPLTDLGTAERWRERFGRDFRFCDVLGWFSWDGRRWKLLSEEKDAVPSELIWSIAVTIRAIRNEAALVAASGYPNERLTAAELEDLAKWADAHGTTSRELYLRGDEDGSRARWLADREPLDVVVGKKLWSQSIAAWAKTAEGGGVPARLMRWIKGFPDIVVRPEQLDADPLAINVENGTLRLVRKSEKRSADEIAAGKSEWHTVGWKVKLHKHDRADLITKLAPVKYLPKRTCPNYDAFLEQVQPDATMRRFLHQWGGYSLTGDVSEDKLAFFYGGGRNGKGTWVEALAHMAGDYAGSIGIESLLDTGVKRRGDQATPDMAELPGVRFLRVSEPQVGMRFNDGLIKQLTGRDPVKARHLNKGFFEFFPSFKMTISGNTKPDVRDVSAGMWARLQLVPWDKTIEEDDIDRTLPAKLQEEASGILNRMIEGLLDWRDNGLVIPEKVREATRAYRDASDQLGRFLRDCCEVGDDPLKVRVNATDLWELFEAWVAQVGGKEWKRNGFVKAMRDRGFEQKTSNGVWWLKVQIRPGVTLEGVRAGDVQGAPEPIEGPESDDFDDGEHVPGFDD